VQAHVARVTSRDDVIGMLEVLLRNPKIARATHNMWAYRVPVRERGTFLQDCDDDGESAAGSRLLHLLQVRHTHHPICALGNDVDTANVFVFHWYLATDPTAGGMYRQRASWRPLHQYLSANDAFVLETPKSDSKKDGWCCRYDEHVMPRVMLAI
jgi:hypothetical protein